MSSLSGRRAVVGASWFLVAVLIALPPIAGLALVAAAFWYGALLSPTEADTGAIQNLSFGELEPGDQSTEEQRRIPPPTATA